MNEPTLSELAASFAKFAEPSDMAYELASTLEHMLVKCGFRDLPFLEMARTIDRETKALNKRYLAMENALGAACQTALIHGTSEDEMRRIADMVEEGDKP